VRQARSNLEAALAEEGLSRDLGEWPETERRDPLADLNPIRGSEQAGVRPVLILSADVFNERSGTVIAVAITGQQPRAGFPLALELAARGLPKRSWVKISQIRTLSVDRIGKKLGRASQRSSRR